MLFSKLFLLDQFITIFWPRISRECNVAKFCQQLSKDVSPQAEQEFIITMLSLLRRAEAEAIRDKNDQRQDVIASIRVSIDSLSQFMNRAERVFEGERPAALESDFLQPPEPRFSGQPKRLKREKTAHGYYWISQYLDTTNDIWRYLHGKDWKALQKKKRQIPPKTEKP